MEQTASLESEGNPWNVGNMKPGRHQKDSCWGYDEIEKTDGDVGDSHINLPVVM